MEKFNTLQDVADYINNTPAEDINWLDVAESVTASGFVDDTDIEDGICHKGDEKVILTSECKAEVWQREQVFTVQFFDKDDCTSRDDIRFEEWSNNLAIEQVKEYLANDMNNSAYAILRDDEGTIVATIKEEE